MASMGLDDDELKALETMVGRMAQLSSSIQSLKMDVLKSNPLPPTASLQASAQIIQRNLQTLLECLNENSELFTRLAVHPSPNFPGRTQENVLTQLLRKKLEPDVEELVSQGRDMSKMATPEGLAALQEVWEEARGWTQKRIAEYVRDEAGDVYSVAEREMGIEKVRTGLRRPLEEESDEDEDEDEDEEDEDGEGGSAEGRGSQQQGRAQSPPPPRGPEPETLFWFGARADFEVPPNVEYERKGNIYRGLQGVGMPPEAMQDVMQG